METVISFKCKYLAAQANKYMRIYAMAHVLQMLFCGLRTASTGCENMNRLQPEYAGAVQGRLFALRRSERTFMINNKQSLGKYGEALAAGYLTKLGYSIICRNYRCRAGEIDIVAADGDTVCFVEVKTRRSTFYGLPCEAVDRRKLLHIVRAAHFFMKEKSIEGFCDYRIDAVEVLVMNSGNYLNHIKGIYSEGGD